MSRQRLAFAWIACFAVLFNMLAMPLSGALAQASTAASEQVLWGSFCTSSGTRMVAITISDLEQKAPQSDEHSTMQHCWCCSGSTPLVALPGHPSHLHLARLDAHRNPPTLAFDAPTPRQQWPGLNPRASPLS